MRIISGKYKGRRITGNKIFNARPTTDFARESMFNILNNYFFFDQIRVLDLFSGSGSISFEFISRGCKNVELVESDSKNYKLICNTIKDLNIEDLRPIKGDAFWYLEKCAIGYDIIFADPPFDLKGIENIPIKVFERNLLKEEGWLILEHSKNYNFKDYSGFKEERKYGAVHFSIFIK